MQPTLGSLFAGIGGIDLGFERAGFKTAWQVEIDPYCRKVLARHFPDAERFEDVRRVGAGSLRRVDVIAGGFPCQDISNAGKRAGIDGERSGLWSEYARIIGELRPRFVFVENVTALLGRGLGRVLGDLAALGFNAEWDCIPACSLGSPHRRDRLWLVAYPSGEGLEGLWSTFGISQEESIAGYVAALANTEKIQRLSELQQRGVCTRTDGSSERISWSGLEWDEAQPLLCRVDDGLPNRSHRIEALGNAVVPQIPELIARRIYDTLARPTP